MSDETDPAQVTTPPEPATDQPAAASSSLSKPLLAGIGVGVLLAVAAIGYVLFGGGDDDTPDIDGDLQVDLVAASTPIVDLRPGTRWDLDSEFFITPENENCSYFNNAQTSATVRPCPPNEASPDAIDIIHGDTLELGPNARLITSGFGCPDRIRLRNAAPTTTEPTGDPALCIETSEGAIFVIYQTGVSDLRTLHMVGFKVSS